MPTFVGMKRIAKEASTARVDSRHGPQISRQEEYLVTYQSRSDGVDKHYTPGTPRSADDQSPLADKSKGEPLPD